jgi:hypothetical protein
MSMSLHPHFAFIDESGTPFFDPERPEEGYVVVSTLIPQTDLAAARLLVPRATNGQLLKASAPNATDEPASQFMTSLFAETRAQIGLITAALSDPDNAQRMKRMKTGIDRSPFPRRSRPSISDAIRMNAALSAFGLSLEGLITQSIPNHIQVVFDRGSERSEFMKKVRHFMCSQTLSAAFVIDDVQWLSRDEEPLIMASDWIAGSVRRDMKADDLPLTRRIMASAKAKGRLHDKEGFSAYLPKQSTME